MLRPAANASTWFSRLASRLPEGRRLEASMFCSGLLLLALVISLTSMLSAEPGEGLTRNTVRLSLAWYTVTLCLMMQLSPQDWAARTPLGRLTRCCWSWAILCFLVHLAVAFHYYHGWSHANAFERTRQISGVGEGIYTSYLFTWLWLLDAVWWWTWPSSYAERSRWIDRTLHAFMLFIVFNGMIVYETGPIRWAGVLLFLLLPAVWIRRATARTALGAESA